MGLILLEALGAGLVLILIVWWTMFSGRKNGELHEVKSPLILQPGPAALTDGLDALKAIVARWSERQAT